MLGKRIYELRKAFNVSQEEFALAINTSRQSVSKWELGDSYPEVNKLKEIASFFNVSIDYLLGYDINNTSCEDFINKLNLSINNKEFDISINEIKSYVSRFNNNLNLYLYSANYLFALELENNTRELLDLIISYFNKGISLYNTQETKDVVLNDIHLSIIQVYIVYKKYDLAMDYMDKNKIYNNRALAECNYRLKKYKETSNIASNIYFSSISDIYSSAHLQIRILLKQKNYLEAYELTNWIINLINSIIKKDNCFMEENILYLYLKLVCEKVLNIECENTIHELKQLLSVNKNITLTQENVKFYYGDSLALYSDIKNYKERIKEEIIEDKDEIFDFYNEAFKDIFGGDLNE